MKCYLCGTENTPESVQCSFCETVFKEKDELRGQATGQDDFPLEAYEQHKFRFEQAGINLEFKPEDNIMILDQGGATTEFKKEK